MTDFIIRETNFNSAWTFSRDKAIWREVRLPHDWSVEHAFDPEKGEGATGYLPGGIGWYCKTFARPAPADGLAFLYFDGVYNNSEVWINGVLLGVHPYGYSPFYYDLTPHLQDENRVEVKVDHSRYADSRWYTGSGIYRDVTLVTLNRLHIPIWGTVVTTPDVSKEQATVNIEVTVKNAGSHQRAFDLDTHVLGPNGDTVASCSETRSQKGSSEETVTMTMQVHSPLLWDVDHPHQYRTVTTITEEGQLVDRYETPFGIRTIRFDPDDGFFLNGRNRKIKGVCLHHDGGLVGAAVPRGVWRRRLLTLKDGGCNAVRISHNPGSKDFVSLCDELGILVQVEFFDEWDNPKDKRLNTAEKSVDAITRGYGEHFQAWAERDLKATMLRDRNHPSVFQWSIGNEIEWTYPRDVAATGFFDMKWDGNYFWSVPPRSFDEIRKCYEQSESAEYTLADTAHKLAAWTRELDTTRPVIANCILPSVSMVSGYADALDIVGFSYRRVMYDHVHRHFPEKIIMGTENLGQWHEWKAVMDRPFVSGTFLWTGIDYLGESNKKWPEKAKPCGLLDSAGFKKPSFHMMKTLWNDEPHVYIATQVMHKSQNTIDEATGEAVAKDPDAWQQALWHWQDVNEHWNYADGEMISVEVYSNCETVELFLDDESLGAKKLSEFEDRIYKWAVPFREGRLVARGGGAEWTVASAGEPTGIQLTADCSDVAHIVAQLVDAEGNPVRHEEREIRFVVDGDAELLGVDNGAPDSVQDYQSDKLVTSQGRALLILRAEDPKARIQVTATSAGLKEGVVELSAIPV